MIEANHCPKCKNRYEVIFDEGVDLFDEDDEPIEIDEEESYPRFCPFCAHEAEYGSEDDGSGFE